MPAQTRQRKGAAREVTPSRDKRKVTFGEKASAEPQSLFRRTWKRVVLRVVLVCCSLLFYQWYKSTSVRTLAAVSEKVTRFMDVPCSDDYNAEKSKFAACVPKLCSRAVVDDLFSPGELNQLLKTAKAGMALGGSSGGASILDLHSGALSKGQKFVDIYTVMEDKDITIFTEADMENYKNIKNRIQATIAKHFKIPVTALYLTKPTFFSQMVDKPAKTVHDEYWHVHVDKETYGSFHYTSLLYLADYQKDFTGGRFVFVDSPKNTTVEPKKGRLSFFTSGSENPHHVEKVESGARYAITVSFTCDPQKAINDPSLDRAAHSKE